MDNRYKNLTKFANNSDEYSEFFEYKGIKNPVQNVTFKMNNISKIDLSKLNFVFHLYKSGEKLYNISNKYYGAPEYGWMILLTNQISDQNKLYDGKYLKIYVPLETLLGAI